MTDQTRVKRTPNKIHNVDVRVITRLLTVTSLIVFYSLAITPVHGFLTEDTLKVDMIKYDPYPVKPGSDFDLWVQVSNPVEINTVGATLEFVPEYPFSIAEGGEQVKKLGAMREEDTFVYRFRLHVDEDALVGTNSLDIGYRIKNVFTKKNFDIEVGNDVVATKGTVEISGYTLNPPVLLPGDIATLTVTLKNTASDYTVEVDGQDYLLDAQVQSAELKDNSPITVLSEPYHSAGLLGPGNSLQLHFSVKADTNASNGMYLLPFKVRGSTSLYQLNTFIPVTVDSSAVTVALSEKPTDSVVLDVANTLQHPIYAVTVIPVGNTSLEPSTYFIGTMDSDELFTIKFNIPDKNPEDINFTVYFKNGNNEHWTPATTVRLNNSNTELRTEQTDMKPLIIIVSLFLVLIVGFYGFMSYQRRKKEKSGEL